MSIDGLPQHCEHDDAIDDMTIDGDKYWHCPDCGEGWWD